MAKSRTSKSTVLARQHTTHFKWWIAIIVVGLIAIAGILVLRLSHASGPQGIMLVDGQYTHHDNGSYIPTPDGIAWRTNSDIGSGHWQWYGPMENLTVWPNDAAKSLAACWTLRDYGAPYGNPAEYVLDITTDNGSKVLASRTVKGQEGAFKTTANSISQQCLSVDTRNGYYPLNHVEYRLSMRKGGVDIFYAKRQLVGTITSDANLPETFPEYIWPLMPGVGAVRSHNDPQGGGCWNDVRNGHGHSGVDIATPINSTVVASKGGTVQSSGNDPSGYGNYIVINGGNGWYTLYGHLNRRDVNAGQQVGQGQQIGLSGNTGNAAGTVAHLHFQVQNNPNVGAGVGSGTINPLSVLPQTTGRDYGGCTP